MKICFIMKTSFQLMMNQIKNENISNSEDVSDSIDNPQNTDQSTSNQNDDCYHNQKHHQTNIQIGIILKT